MPTQTSSHGSCCNRELRATRLGRDGIRRLGVVVGWLALPAGACAVELIGLEAGVALFVLVVFVLPHLIGLPGGLSTVLWWGAHPTATTVLAHWFGSFCVYGTGLWTVWLLPHCSMFRNGDWASRTRPIPKIVIWTDYFFRCWVLTPCSAAHMQAVKRCWCVGCYRLYGQPAAPTQAL